MKVTIMRRNVYGVDLNYPVCETGKKLAVLTGRKTLSKEHLKIIESMGYDVEFVL